jgi:hypothetical protein
MKPAIEVFYMTRKLFIFMVVLPAVVAAGAWTGLGVSHAVTSPGTMVVFASHTSSLWISAIDFVSQITEETFFLALGVCFILSALALHRKSAKHSGR